MAASIACPRVEARELIFLFRGEVDKNGGEITRGHPSIVLAAEIARMCEPKSCLALFGILYPGWELHQIPDAERLTVRTGYDQWRARRKEPDGHA